MLYVAVHPPSLPPRPTPSLHPSTLLSLTEPMVGPGLIGGGQGALRVGVVLSDPPRARYCPRCWTSCLIVCGGQKRWYQRSLSAYGPPTRCPVLIYRMGRPGPPKVQHVVLYFIAPLRGGRYCGPTRSV
eukprot:3228639-Rhodomonas_salina.3